MLKENKGITLVALIITIIVMLILAGVSISLVVGQDGVLTQAQSVEPAQVNGSAREAVSMANADIMATYYGDTTTGKTKAIVTADTILAKIQDNYSYNDKNALDWEEGTAPILPNAVDGTVDATLVIDNLTTNNTINVTIKLVSKGTAATDKLFSVTVK